MALALRSHCPDFDLVGTDGTTHSIGTFTEANLLVVIVSCNHCPYVMAYEERIVSLSREYGPKGVAFMAVNANDAVRYPDDGMAAMTRRAKERGFDFPYVRDDPQAFVRALGARFTPEVFVFDEPRTLRYHGRIDDNHRDVKAVTTNDLKNAIDALLADGEPPVAETTPFGCSVKWK